MNRKCVLVMVGLPARGKSYTAQKLARYLLWLGYSTRVFNVGQQRRDMLGPQQPAEFFDPRNLEGRDSLRMVASVTLDELVKWLHDEGRIAIYDATNSTRERRDWVTNRCADEGFQVQFIELINDDSKIIENNVRATKLKSPDYEGVDEEQAVRDFRQRIAYYESTYEPVADDEGGYIKLINRNRKVVLHEVDGYIPARIAAFLTNLQIADRPIWLSRHGESMDNVHGHLGGNSPLSPRGLEYARNLADYVNRNFGSDDRLHVWTSTFRRAVECARQLGRVYRTSRSLDEINAGVCEGMTYQEVKRSMPDEYAARAHDKLRYCYPHGESYLDVIQRLDRVILEIERLREPVLIIAHQAVLRALYGYFLDIPVDRIPYLDVPLHTVIQLRPRAYECGEQRVPLPPRGIAAASSS